MKKHEILETEVNVREELVRAVEKTGEHLISEEHYASEDIAKNNKSLQEAWKTLLVTLDARRKKLNYSLKVQEVSEFFRHSRNASTIEFGRCSNKIVLLKCL